MTTHTPIRCSNSVMTQRGANEVVLLNTGNYPSYSNFLNETWTWNGTDWHNVSAALLDGYGPLPGRSNMVMSYDGTNVVMFSGQGGPSVGTLADTWTWNGAVWTKATPATSPFGRYKAEMSYLAGTGAVMFGGFGGAGNGVYLNEIWVWNGTTWALLSPATSPSARVDHAMAAGPSSVIVFGGSSSNSQLNDTWSFNGTTWTQLSPATAPSIRSGASMAYDTVNSIWVLFGGTNGYNYLPETWTFNGTTWTQVSIGAGPTGRVNAQMCFDGQSGKTLMFGGTDATNNYPSNQTWSFNGATKVWTKL